MEPTALRLHCAWVGSPGDRGETVTKGRCDPFEPGSLFKGCKRVQQQEPGCKDHETNSLWVKTIIFIGIYNQQFQGSVFYGLGLPGNISIEQWG